MKIDFCFGITVIKQLCERLIVSCQTCGILSMLFLNLRIFKILGPLKWVTGLFSGYKSFI